MTSLANSINNVNTASAANVAASTTAANSSSGSAASMTQSDFLQLLTAQLKYQSPTNPADPTQLAQEFASISTVDGINSLNSKLSAMTTSNGASQIAQASGLVGKQVGVEGNSLTANANGDAAGVFSLPSATANTAVTVLNAKGSIVGTLNLGPLSAGQQNFNWSGGTAGANYSYQVTAADDSGDVVQATPYSVYNVQSVNVSGSTPTLNVAGSSTVLPVSSVQIVLGAS